MCAHARVMNLSCVNDTDIRTWCSPHPLIVDCLLAPPTLLSMQNMLVIVDCLLAPPTLLSMQNMLEQGPVWCWFNNTQFSYHCVHPKMFSIQMLLYTFLSNCAEGLHFSAFHYDQWTIIINRVKSVMQPKWSRNYILLQVP